MNINLTQFQKCVDAFVASVKSGDVQKSDMVFFYHFLKEVRLPPSANHLRELHRVSADPSYNSEIFHKIVTLGTKLAYVLGDPIAEKEADQKEHSGSMWECIDRIPNKGGGFLYVFRLRNEYDDITVGADLVDRKAAVEKKYLEMYPAIEMSASDLSKLRANNEKEEYDAIKKKLREEGKYLSFWDKKKLKNEINTMIKIDRHVLTILQGLGYRFELSDKGIFLTLPDCTALLQKWDKLREIRPDLKSLNLKSHDGIADDLSYIESFFTNHTFFAKRKEFVHDQTIHIIPKLYCLLTPIFDDEAPTIGEQRIRMLEMIAKIYHMIHFSGNLDIFRTMLAAWVDVITSYSYVEQFLEIGDLTNPDVFVDRLFDMEEWVAYFEQRFGPGSVNTEELKFLYKRFIMRSSEDIHTPG